MNNEELIYLGGIEPLDFYKINGIVLLEKAKHLLKTSAFMESTNADNCLEYVSQALVKLHLVEAENKLLKDACIEAKMLLETDPRYPGFKDCDCGSCTMCKIKNAIT